MDGRKYRTFEPYMLCCRDSLDQMGIIVMLDVYKHRSNFVIITEQLCDTIANEVWIRSVLGISCTDASSWRSWSLYNNVACVKQTTPEAEEMYEYVGYWDEKKRTKGPFGDYCYRKGCKLCRREATEGRVKAHPSTVNGLQQNWKPRINPFRSHATNQVTRKKF